MTTFYNVPSATAASTSGTTAGTSGTSGTRAGDNAGSADRFLTLLVAQLENQDPLNPMDNAQVTSQMAQISTVTGIEKLNETMKAMNTSNLQSQTLQGAAMVGRNVLMDGNRLSMAGDGKPQGVFELAGAASSVKVEILSAGGAVVDTLELGAMEAGRHDFDWTAKTGAAAGENFRISAKAGKTDVSATTLVRDRVDAVVTGADTLTLELSRFGSVPFEQIRIVN
jgi:flagellar basal-body rod modification protein FlgD